MTKKISTQLVDKVMFSNYLVKAVENCKQAVKALGDGAYNAAAVSAVHAAISAADAYCVSGLSKRCSSSNHEDTAELIETTMFSNKTIVSKKFMSIIRIKNMAEYEERLVKQKEAEKAVQEAEGLLALVKKDLKEE